MRTTTYKIGNVMRSVVASLIILASLYGIAKGENSTVTILTGEESSGISTNNQELANQMETWIKNSAYWSDETENQEQELALQMKSWMDNSAYWSSETENQESELALQMKTWINDSALWSGNNDNKELELTLQIKSWMNDSAYWNESEEQINWGNDLANN